MASTNKVIRIGVLGHVGNENLGDEALIAATIKNIKNRMPNADICGFTMRPEDTRKRHNIAAFPLRRMSASVPTEIRDDRHTLGTSLDRAFTDLATILKSVFKKTPRLYSSLKKLKEAILAFREIFFEPAFLLRCYKNMEGVDLLMIAGSSQLIDYGEGGAWGHPYTIFKWVLIAKIRDAKVAFMSCGAGPVQTSLGRFFLRIALSMADYRSCRDDASKKCVEQLGVTNPTLVYPDLAYDMAVEQPSTSMKAQSDRPIVGINAVPFSDPQAWVGGGALIYEAYILKLATFALWLISRGYAVTFFPTQLRLDPPVVNDLIRVTSELSETNLEKHLLQCRISSFDDLTNFIGMTDMIVATRFHGVVFSYLLNKPVLGIAYALKTRELMAQMGQEDYALDIFQIDVEMVKERFIALEARQKEIKDEISRRLASHRQALAKQYEEVFGLIRKSEI